MPRYMQYNKNIVALKVVILPVEIMKLCLLRYSIGEVWCYRACNIDYYLMWWMIHIRDDTHTGCGCSCVDSYRLNHYVVLPCIYKEM